jgi:predicted RNA-binding protein with EMAP domain
LISANFTVRLELAWSMTDSSGQKILLRKSIETLHTAKQSESFSGANRLRLAVEGAVRKNIESILQELALIPN